MLLQQLRQPGGGGRVVRVGEGGTGGRAGGGRGVGGYGREGAGTVQVGGVGGFF